MLLKVLNPKKIVNPRKAFVLAGGKGERLKPLTNNTPKPLLKVKGKPILEWIIERLSKFNVNEIVLGLGHQAEKIEEYFGDGNKWNTEIIYSIEKEMLGTGGALKLAEKFFDERFYMLNGDNMCDINYNEINEFHEVNEATATIALFPVLDVTSFGIADLKENKIVRFIEKPRIEEAPSNLNNAGVYVLEPEIFELLPKEFNAIEKTVFPKLAVEGKLFGYKHESQWFPTDTIERLKEAEKKWKGI